MPKEPCGDSVRIDRAELEELRTKAASYDKVLSDIRALDESVDNVAFKVKVAEKVIASLTTERDEARTVLGTARKNQIELAARLTDAERDRDSLRTRLERAADMLQDSRNVIQALMLSRDPVHIRRAEMDAAWDKAHEQARKTLLGIDSFEPLTSVVKEGDEAIAAFTGMQDWVKEIRATCEARCAKCDSREDHGDCVDCEYAHIHACATAGLSSTPASVQQRAEHERIGKAVVEWIDGPAQNARLQLKETSQGGYYAACVDLRGVIAQAKEVPQCQV